MVSIIPTYQHTYKGFWFSPNEDPFMDQGTQGKFEHTHSKQSAAPLTDPTSFQSLHLVPDFTAPTRPLQLKFPDVGQSRKRKASDVEDLTMSQQQNHRRRTLPQTINPSTLTSTSSDAVPLQYSAVDYASQMPVSTAQYQTAWQQPQTRRDSAPPSVYPTYGINPTSTWYPDQSPSQRSSISMASTGSQSMTPMQPFAPQMPYNSTMYPNSNTYW